MDWKPMFVIWSQVKYVQNRTVFEFDLLKLWFFKFENFRLLVFGNGLIFIVHMKPTILLVIVLNFIIIKMVIYYCCFCCGRQNWNCCTIIVCVGEKTSAWHEMNEKLQIGLREKQDEAALRKKWPGLFIINVCCFVAN
jgi:hypothetical protein